MRSLAIGAGGLILSATVLAVPPPAPPPPMPVVPDDAPSGREFLDRVIETLRTVDSVAYRAVERRWLNGEPAWTCEGEVTLRRAEGEGASGAGRLVRGEFIDHTTGERRRFEYSSVGSMVTGIDHDSGSVHRAAMLHGGRSISQRLVRGSMLTHFKYLQADPGNWWAEEIVPDDLGGDPALGAGSRVLLMRERQGQRPGQQVERFGADHLPRGYVSHRIDREGNEIVTSLAISDLRVNVPAPDGAFLVTLPPEYERITHVFPPFDPELDDRSWVGRRAPGWTFETVEGEEYTPSEERGRITMLYFWSRACLPCVQQLPKLQEMHEKLSARGLDLVAVNTWDDDLAGATEFLRERGCTFTSVGSGTPYVQTFGTNGLPNQLLIGAHGEVLDVAGRNVLWRRGGFDGFVDDYMAQLNVR